MRCHYVEKRIYLIQTRYVLLQHACQKLAKHVILLIYCHLLFFTHQTKVGKLGNMWGIIPQKLGKRKVEAQIMNEKRDTRQKNTQNMPINLLYLPFFQSENISSGKQEIWLNSYNPISQTVNKKHNL